MRKPPIKTQEGAGYEADGGHSTPVQTVEFPYDLIDGGKKEEADIIGDEPRNDARTKERRREVEAWLKERGLSRPERVAVWARLNGKSVGAIAAEVGKSPAWVSETLHQPKVRECLKRLQRGPSLSMGNVAAALAKAKQMADEVGAGPSLTDAMKQARAELTGRPNEPGHIALVLGELGLSAKSNDMERVVAQVAVRPDLLLLSQGRPLLEKFVEIVTTARFGGKEEAARAQKALGILARGKQGRRHPVPDGVLASSSVSICVALSDLRRAKRKGAKLEDIRELIGEWQERFSDREFQSILNGDLSGAAARVAEKATGINAKCFARAWRQFPSLFDAGVAGGQADIL